MLNNLSMKNTMSNINYYRYPNARSEADSWKSCQFTSDTDLSAYTIQPLVTINGQPFLRQHHSTYLTGKETCRAHHFAKYLAIQVLKGESVSTSPVPCAGASATVLASDAPVSTAPAGKVLWIDTLHGPHICTAIYNELVAHAPDKKNLHFVCLDFLGEQRGNVFALNRNIEALIGSYKPDLVVIDDIDHLMPFCGVNTAKEFCNIVRDVTNHTETAFLFIGYNHLNKKASTTGNLGKYLFLDASDVFSLSTQREVTTVRLIRSYDLSRNPDNTEYHFTIGPDNLPQRADVLPAAKPIDDNTLRDIIRDTLQPGEPITPDQLLHEVTTRYRHLKHQQRATDLITQALHLNLIKKLDNQQDAYTPTTSINTPLTLPPHPSNSPSYPAAPSSASSPSSAATCPVVSGSAAEQSPSSNPPCC